MYPLAYMWCALPFQNICKAKNNVKPQYKQNLAGCENIAPQCYDENLHWVPLIGKIYLLIQYQIYSIQVF